ncbi:alpha/beta hydrolase [Penaeicola halotolerans]|uniref:alpha/beta hydrolase n=1 Tax=Penaeicola halotolerans TaxID=2793196 RepID=UPI001CF85362|nr:dienelactone hydrolase family protein [Penaeicola halotolerans]
MENLHQIKNTVYAGCPLDKAKSALIMVHGRGDSSDKMQNLAEIISEDPDRALIFPKATFSTWYPKGFLEEWSINQPWLDSALTLLDTIVSEITAAGVKKENIYFLGFSQGACLSLEYVTRNATKYAGVMILSGGLIGPRVEPKNYTGDFSGTPIFMGCSDIDHHIPVHRLEDSEKQLTKMGAKVNLKIYPGMDHIISEDEIEIVKEMLK